MAAKKVSKNGASDRAKKAQASRLNAQSRAADQPRRGRRAASERITDQGFRNQNELWRDEGGRLYSTALYNKDQLNFARQQAQRVKDASRQMREGVTKSGGYAGAGLGTYYVDKMRNAKSAKFKAEQATKKNPMTRKPANKKKGAR